MHKSSRYWIRLILTFIRRFKLIIISGIVFGIGIFVFINIIFPHFAHNSERIGIVGEYTPDNLPKSILELISSGLTVSSIDGTVHPAIAENWEVKDSGKIWTFHLSKNKRWQDGSEVTSNSVNYNFNDAEVIREDKYTVTFKFATGFSPFPSVVTKPLFKTGLLGVGEWKVIKLTLAGSYVETLTLENKDKDIRIYKFYPTESRAKLAYQLGQIDQLNDLVDSKPFDTWNTLNLTKNINKQKQVAIFFNTTDGLTGDKDFRQALNYAINKDKYEDIRSISPISSNSWSYNPSVKQYNSDESHAKELIKQAKIDPEARKDLKIKLTTTPELLLVAEEIANEWKNVGIETNLQVTAYLPEDFQAFLTTYDIPFDPDQYFIWHSSQSKNNISRYKNVRIDKLLEDGRLETNVDKRKQIYFDFQRFLVEDSPAIFLYYPSYYNISRI